MAVLITGAGLLGRWVARQLVEEGDEVVLFDYAPPVDWLRPVLASPRVTLVEGNVCEGGDLKRAFARRPIDGVIHTAAVMGPAAAKHWLLSVRVNVEGTLLVCQMAAEARLKKLVFASSLAVYGDGGRFATEHQEDHQISPPGVYGATKGAAELILSAFAREHQLSATILRLAGLFGPGTYQGGAWLAPTIDRAIRRLMRGESAVIDFFPPEGMEMLYVKDAASAMVSAYHHSSGFGGVLNVGTGGLCSARDFVFALNDIFPRADINAREQDAKSSSRTPVRPLAVTKARDRIGFVAQYDLRRALADYVAELTAALGGQAEFSRRRCDMHEP